MELRRYYAKRTIIDIAPIVGEQEYFLVPLSIGAISVIRSLLEGYGLWQSTYIKSRVNHFQYEVPTGSEWDKIDEIVSEAIYCLQRDDLMSCLQLSDDLQAINTTIDDFSTQMSTDITSLIAKLEEIRSQLATSDLSTELDDIEPILDNISTILGAAAILGA